MKKEYELVHAANSDMEILIKYKLASILDYGNNIEQEERDKIINYVKNNIPKQISDYKVIKIDDKIVGCLLLERYEDGILIDEIYLEDNYRQRGIGTDIIVNILDNNSKVYLWVYKENEKAIKLYKKLNFKIRDITKTRYFMEYQK